MTDLPNVFPLVRPTRTPSQTKIDRAAWAAEVERLIAEEAAGNRAEFVRLIGVGYKTVDRWRMREVDVREESVRKVAHALKVSARALLLRVGYYSADDLDSAEPPAAPESDPVIDAIIESPLTTRTKQTIIARIYAERRAFRAKELSDVQWYIAQQRGA